ncbi:nicotinate (nicotinamide) nucleotide adenylyltransferase [Helicobacter sp. MIT 14-3879]|uniref:nicotinate (nicotinamide) nucleotide adenylyltransferase n=1 Tax=Helicobacter sp. MIT 14-3879 TaxID=2040649 RepID=UPI0015F18A08|nr:nicotinate (nicotinamide) nucleotide adenylyltransferase [Helicobacter sp. MIT 14-3879]
MNIAIFGGSFDPLHNGHLEIIKESIKLDYIDLLIILPNFLNPFKSKNLFSAKVRFELIKYKTKDLKKILISDFEIIKSSYSIDSVLHFKKLYNPSKIYFIIGADNLKTLHKWHRINDLKKEVEFIIVTRNNISIPKNYLTINIKENISSSFIREHINDYFMNFNIKSSLIKKMKDEINYTLH